MMVFTRDDGELILPFIKAVSERDLIEWVNKRRGKSIVADYKRQVFIYYPSLDR